MAAFAGPGIYGAYQQRKAADAALSAQMEQAAIAEGQIERNIGAAKNIVGEGSAAAQQQYQQYLSGAMGDVRGGYAGALGELSGGYGMAAGALSPLQQLQGYGAQATQAVNLGDPFANFQQDPGYQFRQQQGEQAINRAASAAGGRVSGRTMKEMAKFNQGLASQEFQNFSQRQLAARGQNLSAALSAQQNQMALAGLGFGAQSQLAGFGMQYGQGAAGMHAQQGQMLGQMGMNAGQYMSGLTYGTAQQQANLNVNRANLYAGLAGSTMAAQTGPVPYAGGEAMAASNSLSQIAGAGMQAAASGG